MRRGGEIISCDSTAVYRGFDIGTDKVPLAERRGIPHHLIDNVEPTEEYTAARYVSDAVVAIEADLRARAVAHHRGRHGSVLSRPRARPVSGTGRGREVRSRLEAIAQRRGVEFLHRMLKRVDAASAARIQPRDLKRMVRALEVFFLTGTALTDHFAATVSPLAGYQTVAVALSPPMTLIAERVATRVDAMAGDTPVLLLKHDGHLHALHDRCSHRGCLLERRSGRGRVGHLPLPRLPLQPSRRLDRTGPRDRTATRVRDPRERRPDRCQAPPRRRRPRLRRGAPAQQPALWAYCALSCRRPEVVRGGSTRRARRTTRSRRRPVRPGTIPFRIVRATQWFEFVGRIARRGHRRRHGAPPAHDEAPGRGRRCRRDAHPLLRHRDRSRVGELWSDVRIARSGSTTGSPAPASDKEETLPAIHVSIGSAEEAHYGNAEFWCGGDGQPWLLDADSLTAGMAEATH